MPVILIILRAGILFRALHFYLLLIPIFFRSDGHMFMLREKEGARLESRLRKMLVNACY